MPPDETSPIVELDNPHGHPLAPGAPELLPRLFAGCERLQIGGELGGGFSGSRVLLVQPYRAGGVAELTAVVKIGPAALVDQEYSAYRSLIEHRVAATPEIRRPPVYSADGALGALSYGLVGSGLFDIETLADYGPPAALADLVHVLESRLFVHLGFLWRQAEARSGSFGRSGYDRLLPVNWVLRPDTVSGAPATHTLSPEHRPPAALAIGERVAVSGLVVTELEPETGRVTLDAPGGGRRVRLAPVADVSAYRFGEPPTAPLTGVVTATRASLLADAFGRAIPPTYLGALAEILDRPRTLRVGAIHGDLNLANVLVDPAARTVRLIDFAASREDHVLHDLLRLETGVLTRWLPEALAQADRRPAAVADLLRQLHAAPEREPAHPALRKVYVTLATLRRAAAGLLAEPGDWREYHEGLALYLLAAGKYGDVPAPARAVAWAGAEAALALAEEPGADAARRDGAVAALLHRNPALEAYRRGRLEEWSGARYELDERFVALTLLVDAGEENAAGRWQAQAQRYTGLDSLLADIADPAVVVLGPPGCGKSTLLRHYELARAIDGLRGGAGNGGDAVGPADPLTFFVQLNRYSGAAPGEPPPAPGLWLADEWRLRHPELPALDELLRDGRMVLLLDALNEMPHRTYDGYGERVLAWKAYVQKVAALGTGSRIVFSCRSLDYSAPLSTPALRVPQVQVQPLDDDQVRRFLERYSPAHAEALWSALAGTPQLDLVRAPYFLKLLVDQAGAAGRVPRDRAGLFTGFVRRALVREIQRDNRLFRPNGLVAERDYERVVQGRGWRSEHELPERGSLFPALARLAYDMQEATVAGEVSQVRIGYDEALARIGSERAGDVLRAGAALGVLGEDKPRDEVLFVHQLLQEYFAARRLATEPNPVLVRAPWRAEEITPSVRELIETLPAAEPLPALPRTGWEETTLLAAAMTDQPEAFVRGVMATNLSLAGRCAALAGLRQQLPEALLDTLRWALVARSRDPAADLRARIAAGLALGDLGDPRFERRKGPYGEYLLPPMVEIPGGQYTVGADQPIEMAGTICDTHIPEHRVKIDPFGIGEYPVTNAEWKFFILAGGYDNPRWWKTQAAAAWRRGEGTGDGMRAGVRYWWRIFGRDRSRLEALHQTGTLDDQDYEKWTMRLSLSEEAFESYLVEKFPDERITAPRRWHDAMFNHPSLPVIDICWFEAVAYCNWMSAQTGHRWKLPTEVEWEAAARGKNGRSFPSGDDHDSLSANTVETRIRNTTPIGVFAEGDTPEAVSDMIGNVLEWTSSRYRQMEGSQEFAYPYDPSDGREDMEAAASGRRVIRGGSYFFPVHEVYRRDGDRAINWKGIGFRIARPPVHPSH